MTPIRSATLTVLASAILATSLTGCQFSSEQQDTGEIVVRADLELSGASAPVGEAYKRALELKVEQINESGVLGGRTLSLTVKDNRSDPNESLRNIGEFAADPKVSAIIMGSCDACAVAAAKPINEKKIPTIALAAANNVATPVADRRYVFKLAPNAADSASALVSELKLRPAIKKVGVLYTDDAYGRDGQSALAYELGKTKLKTAPPQPIKPTDTDFTGPVTAMIEAEADAIIVWTNAEQSVLAATQARADNYQGQLFFDAGAAGDLFLEGAGGQAAENTTMVFSQTMVIDDVIATTPAKAARKQWFRDYTARFGGYYGSSSFAADALQLITDAAVRAGSTSESVNRDGLRDVLETSQIDGLSGPIRMTPDNHSGLMPQALSMLVARGGRWRLAS
ncbi:ABC transporter substrate-binding protein [Micromonospora sp. NBC_01796]|uniref:ABC transporter substrate-binding protein n=1 Tax=Micromonospora sp. NBC_01796 TaxID=2975987 RepID=UPI002DD8AA96|nr:ABC transporter substrate-binding protein [Micromonospora sp. NBC_01796]WSA87733.1 ABC transporter substrate-binding protein [Micromonospora sp. NBC_01796]